jgi:polyhydroxyalkanoate synthesis regulator phasin
MPAAKRAATTNAKSKSAPKAKTAKAASSSSSSAAKGKKAETTKSAKATPSKSAARSTAAAKTAKAAPKTAKSSAPRTARSTARTSAASSRAKSTDGTRAAAARVKRAASTDTGVISLADQLVKGSVKPKDIVMLTREHIQDALDDAASRGRVTRKDANELVAELVRRGRSGGDDVRSEIEDLLGRGKQQIGSATKRAARSEPVDRIVRGADRARRAAGVGSSFPISGYPELNVSQVQARLKELSKPELRKVLSYERKHANRKSVVGAIEKSL